MVTLLFGPILSESALNSVTTHREYREFHAVTFRLGGTTGVNPSVHMMNIQFAQVPHIVTGPVVEVRSNTLPHLEHVNPLCSTGLGSNPIGVYLHSD